MGETSTVPISTGTGGGVGGPIISAFNSATTTRVLAFQAGRSRAFGRSCLAYAGLTSFGLVFGFW